MGWGLSCSPPRQSVSLPLGVREQEWWLTLTPHPWEFPSVLSVAADIPTRSRDIAHPLLLPYKLLSPPPRSLESNRSLGSLPCRCCDGAKNRVCHRVLKRLCDLQEQPASRSTSRSQWQHGLGRWAPGLPPRCPAPPALRPGRRGVSVAGSVAVRLNRLLRAAS